ncbi:hypothetical protein VCHC72A2_02659B, partial [Vibrio cholerae HC-72A2]
RKPAGKSDSGRHFLPV